MPEHAGDRCDPGDRRAGRGTRTRPALAPYGLTVAWVAYLVLAGFHDSRGKIMHDDVLLLATVPFLAAPLAVHRRDRRARRQLRVAH